MASINSGKVDRWRELLAARDASGESVATFCERQGIPTHQFYWWRRRLDEARRAAKPQPASDSAPFVPVRMSISLPMIEVVHPSGCIVRLAAGVDARSLRNVLEALQAAET